MDQEATAKMHFPLERVTLEAVIRHVYLGVNEVSYNKSCQEEEKVLETGCRCVKEE